MSAVIFEDASAADIILIQLAWGSERVPITRVRVTTGAIGQLPPVHLLRIRSAEVPADERVYYRMRSGAGATTVNVSIRYHFRES